MHDRERSQAVDNEIALVVRVVLPGDVVETDPFEELVGLAETAGAVVVGSLMQRREKPTTATFLGSGKVDELVQLVEFHAADVVIFDNDLSPAQVRNLEQATKVKVLDRTELILDIFASRARTHEARLAVELAQLEYSLPRLKQMWTHLSRIKMGVGMRGPGEKQLEVDRRLVEKRISDLRAQLKEIEKRKERTVAARRDHMTVSLVGYTNAGKSTLLNSLTGSEVYAKDQLFATLDTRTRRWHLPSWGPVLLSDTVGFIRSLPHKLVTSFKATLEETRQADLLLHVADASNPEVLHQIAAVYHVLRELEIEEKDTLLVINKIDHPDALLNVESILRKYPHAVRISAKTQQGFDDLHRAVSDALSRSFRKVDVTTDVSDGKLMSFLAAHGEVLSTEYTEHEVKIHCRIPQKFLGQIDSSKATVVIREDLEQRYGVGEAIARDENPFENNFDSNEPADTSMDDVA